MIRAAQRWWKQVLRAQSYELSEELVLWDFRQPDSLREWNCISDKDIGGYSSVSLGPNGKGASTYERAHHLVHCKYLHFRNRSKVLWIYKCTASTWSVSSLQWILCHSLKTEKGKKRRGGGVVCIAFHENTG